MAGITGYVEDKARKAVDTLASLVNIKAVYLFGSQMEGNTDEWSDIDIAVFIDGIEDWDIHTRAHTSAMLKKEAGDDIELHFFPAEALRDAPPASFAHYILKNGIALDWCKDRHDAVQAEKE